MTPLINTAEPARLAEQFAALAEQWKAETAFLSSTTAMVNHPASQAIISLGVPVVPYLLRDLEREQAHWAVRVFLERLNLPSLFERTGSASWTDWRRRRGGTTGRWSTRTPSF